jgi:hypothetical protein
MPVVDSSRNFGKRQESNAFFCKETTPYFDLPANDVQSGDSGDVVH